MIPLELIRAARERIGDAIVRTPLVRLNVDDAPAEIYLKLENLQPINAYKLRGAANAVALLSDAERKRGVWTISAGNAGQGVAYAARKAGVLIVTSSFGWRYSPRLRMCDFRGLESLMTITRGRLCLKSFIALSAAFDLSRAATSAAGAAFFET